MARIAYVAVALLCAPLAFSQDTTIEEVVVTSSLTHQTPGQIEGPIHVVDGDEISESATQSLGEHLATLAGVSSNNFGPAVGQPVIRGMSGNRVKVLQNGMVIRDVSGVGPDHANDVDLNNVQQIEVVRGPSAILHANGTSGGIINIVDNTIARTDIEEPTITLSAESQSVNDGKGFAGNLRHNVGGFNISYDFKEFDADSYDIPRGAVLHEEEHDEEHEELEGEEEHHEEHDEDMTTLEDSYFETTTHRFGVSRTGDWGYLGASFQDLSSTYGIPFHGAHGGHEDEHEGEHGDEEDHEEGEEHEEEGHGEHEDEQIFSTTDSEILSLEGQFILGSGLVKDIQFSLRDTDYLLTEQHAEEAHEGEEHEGEEEHEEHSEEPTFFSNESTEVQVVFNLGTDDAPRRVVLNQVTEKISILGEEAFMEPVKSTETTLGVFAGLEANGFDIDLGARWDDIERKGTIRELHHEEEEEHEGEEEHHDEEHEGFELEPFTFKDQSLSGAVTIGRAISDSLTASMNLGIVNRTPSAVELFMNGEHLATARYEVGDANLKTERSNNLDLSLSYESNDWYATASIYRNRVDNYIYLRDESEEEHEEHEGEDHGDEEHGMHGDHGGLLLAEFMQSDATFTGYEIELGRRFEFAGGELDIRVQRDEVSADFNNGGNVPRITPARTVVALDYSRDLTSAMLEIQDVDSQTTVSSFETPTAGFTLVNARLAHRIELSEDAVLTISAYGRNLTDEIARNHTSFVKNEVPLAGRNIGIKASLSF
ncbi:MAG TPA: TonB-dependent receptor [Halieaceae bacterium]|nr:TonB-dependent receptor [Halieaceae bacterium]